MTATHAVANDVVLLVQPERDDREMYATYLQHHGFAPVAVPLATDALRMAPRADIVVTDILLAGPVGGIELVARLKSDDQTRRIPTIVVTACVWEAERRRALAAGCDLFLPKPCMPDLLAHHIRRLLALRHVRAAPLAAQGSRVERTRRGA